MMKSKKITALALLLCLLLSTVLSACNNPPEPEVKDETYTVSVVDNAGNAMADVMVSLKKGDADQGMKRLQDGKATFTLPADDYTVSLTFPGGGVTYWYDTTACTLSAEKTSLTVVLYAIATEKEEIWAPNTETGEHEPYDAYFVSEGSTHVSLTAGARSYFLFYPTRAGKYEFSTADGVHVGYYGGTFNVLPSDMGETENGVLVMDVQTGHIGNTFVLGIDGESLSETVLTVTRAGDPKPSVEYDPYIILTDERHGEYFADCVNWGYDGFVYFDITSSHTAVYNETDGYYHLDSADGPLLFIDLKNDREDGYLASFKTICKTSPISAYIYDEDGNYLRKENYNQLLSDNHFEIVPLSAELARAVQSFGKAQGWFDLQSGNSPFSGVLGAKQELLWLYACGYYESEPAARDGGSADAPATLEAGGSNVRLAAGESVYFTTVADAVVYIKGASSSVTVHCGGKTYTADSQGVITFTMPLNVTAMTVTLADGAETDFFTVYEGDPDAVGGR